MARIRSLHPGQWTDERFVACSPTARLLALGLRNEADDNGVFEWKPITIKMRLFANDAVDVTALLGELEAQEQIQHFDADGKRYGAIRNFRKYQRPEKPKSWHPLPDSLRDYVGLSLPDPGRVAEELPTDQRKSPQRKDEGGKRKDGEEGRGRRGTRLAADWAPSDADRGFAQEQGLDSDAVAARFRDHWHSKAGRDGAKLDWPATWRNWCRNDADRTQGGHGRPQPHGKGPAGVIAAAASLMSSGEDEPGIRPPGIRPHEAA